MFSLIRKWAASGPETCHSPPWWRLLWTSSETPGERTAAPPWSPWQQQENWTAGKTLLHVTLNHKGSPNSSEGESHSLPLIHIRPPPCTPSALPPSLPLHVCDLPTPFPQKLCHFNHLDDSQTRLSANLSSCMISVCYILLGLTSRRTTADSQIHKDTQIDVDGSTKMTPLWEVIGTGDIKPWVFFIKCESQDKPNQHEGL